MTNTLTILKREQENVRLLPNLHHPDRYTCDHLGPANRGVAELCPAKQEALSSKYGHKAWIILGLEDGQFALFDNARCLVAIGPWESLLSHYSPKREPERKVYRTKLDKKPLSINDLL